MQIRLGYELVYACPQSTPMILTLNVHYSRVSDLLAPDHIGRVLIAQPAGGRTPSRRGGCPNQQRLRSCDPDRLQGLGR